MAALKARGSPSHLVVLLGDCLAQPILRADLRVALRPILRLRCLASLEDRGAIAGDAEGAAAISNRLDEVRVKHVVRARAARVKVSQRDGCDLVGHELVRCHHLNELCAVIEDKRDRLAVPWAAVADSRRGKVRVGHAQVQLTVNPFRLDAQHLSILVEGCKGAALRLLLVDGHTRSEVRGRGTDHGVEQPELQRVRQRVLAVVIDDVLVWRRE